MSNLDLQLCLATNASFAGAEFIVTCNLYIVIYNVDNNIVFYISNMYIELYQNTCISFYSNMYIIFYSNNMYI